MKGGCGVPEKSRSPGRQAWLNVDGARGGLRCNIDLSSLIWSAGINIEHPDA